MAFDKNVLRSVLSKQRFQHSESVADLASKLASRHGWDPSLAFETGFFHDCVKEWAPTKLISYARRHRLAIPDVEFIRRNNPNMLHAYVGADVARRKKWVTNPVALKAIRSHTLGALNMGIPEMIIYVADFACKDRSYMSAHAVRKEAFNNLRSAFRMAVAQKMKWNLKASKPIHPFAVRVWNSLRAA